MFTEKFKELGINILIDTHLHIGRLSSLNVPSGGDSDIIYLLKKYGIERAVVSHHQALASVFDGLEQTLDMLEKHSPLICAYLVFNPNYSVQSLEIIKEYISFNGVKGVKIHPSWHACYPYDEKYREFWEFANKNRLTVLTHSWNPDAPNRAQKFSDAFFFDSIAKQYPGINLILAHAGGRGSYLYRVMEIVGSNSNVYVDFSGDIFEPGLIKAYVQGLGSSEKLLFGSDMPWIDIRFSISSILNADISVEDKRNIFGLNAMKLFGF